MESLLTFKLINNIQYYDAPGFNGSDFIGSLQKQCKEQFGELKEDATDEEIMIAYAL